MLDFLLLLISSAAFSLVLCFPCIIVGLIWSACSRPNLKPSRAPVIVQQPAYWNQPLPYANQYQPGPVPMHY